MKVHPILLSCVVSVCALSLSGCGGSESNDEKFSLYNIAARLPSQIDTVTISAGTEDSDLGDAHITEPFAGDNVISFSDAEEDDTEFQATVISGNILSRLNTTNIIYTPYPDNRCLFTIEDFGGYYISADQGTVTSYVLHVWLTAFNPETAELTGYVKSIDYNCSSGSSTWDGTAVMRITFQLRSGTAGTTTDPTVENP